MPFHHLMGQIAVGGITGDHLAGLWLSYPESFPAAHEQFGSEILAETIYFWQKLIISAEINHSRQNSKNHCCAPFRVLRVY
jgi:hypothetical protein